LIGCYSGTRADAIASASKRLAVGKSYVDLDRGLYYRKPIGKKVTKKRQPSAPLPPRLLAHMRRWDRLGGDVAKWSAPRKVQRYGFETP
jgi:hypothetical protein